MYRNFIEVHIKEGVPFEKLDEYIAFWHNNHVDKPLNEFLGLTKEEYERWLKNGDDVIKGVILHRKKAE